MNQKIKLSLWLVIIAVMVVGIVFIQFQNSLQLNQEKVFEKLQNKETTELLEIKNENTAKEEKKINKEVKNKIDINRFALYDNYRRYLNNIDNKIKSKFIFKGPNTKKQVALTFDDGPANNTSQIMNVLEEHNVPAAFFLTCDRINEKNIKLYDSDLFFVGFHTYSHKNYDRLSKLEISEDIDKCMDIFKKNNLSTKYFRPAFGIINERLLEILEKNNLQGVIWSIDSFDWKGYKNEILVNRVINNLDNGSIILFHDTIIPPNDLSDIIIGIQEKGFSIVHLEELLEK